MSKRLRIALSAVLMTLSAIATATATTMQSGAPGADPAIDLTTGPAGLLAGAILCFVFMLMVWSDELDRVAIRRHRTRRRA